MTTLDLFIKKTYNYIKFICPYKRLYYLYFIDMFEFLWKKIIKK